MVKTIIKNNYFFFLLYLLFVITGAVIILATSKPVLHLFFNRYHSDFFDAFFSYTTFLGDGLTATIVTIILLMVKYRYALIVGLSSLISSLITQFLKHYIFYSSFRPKKFFEGVADLRLIDGMENYSYYTFPSGHATTAFATFVSMVFLINNKQLKLLLLLTALLVAYSRVYLSQHFFEDIYTGSLIGFITSCFIFFKINPYKPGGKLDSNLLETFKS